MIICETLEKVSGLFFLKDSFFISFKNKISKYNFNYDLIWQFEVPGNIVRFSGYQNSVFIEYISSESGVEKTIVINSSNGQVVSKDYSEYMIRSISENGIAIVLKYNKDYSNHKIMINLESENIEWEKKMNDLPLFVDGNRLISGMKNSISSFNYDGNLNWIYDITELGTWIDYASREQKLEVRQIMGVWNEVLWVNLNNGSFLLMDVNTGIFQKHLRFEDTGFKGNLFQAFIDKDNEIIYGLFLDQLSIFDMKSCTTEVIDLSEEFKNEKIESRKDVIKIGDHLLFGDDYNDKIAALNLESKKLDWVYTFSQEGTSSNERPRSPRKLEVKGNKLFVLDNKNTLHIFERESQSS